MMDKTKAIKETILALYGKYFGSIMAESYATFYADKDLATILTSAKELFEEYAGQQKSTEILAGIYHNYGIQQPA